MAAGEVSRPPHNPSCSTLSEQLFTFEQRHDFSGFARCAQSSICGSGSGSGHAGSAVALSGSGCGSKKGIMSGNSKLKQSIARQKMIRWAQATGVVATAGMLLLVGLLAFASQAPVGLGTASTYSVLGAQTVTNTGPTTIEGDLGVSPGSAVTGFPPGIVLGTVHAADASAAQAQVDLTAAYSDAAGRTATGTVSGDIGARPCPPASTTRPRRSE
jgi:hypothetical protein